jgi:hypothetical protein
MNARHHHHPKKSDYEQQSCDTRMIHLIRMTLMMMMAFIHHMDRVSPQVGVFVIDVVATHTTARIVLRKPTHMVAHCKKMNDFLFFS